MADPFPQARLTIGDLIGSRTHKFLHKIAREQLVARFKNKDQDALPNEKGNQQSPTGYMSPF
jgi:hypothetical protein